MIGKAKSISYGINDIRYITGESRNKKHPELIYHVKDNLLPCRLDAQGVWDMMKARAPKGKNVIRIEVSPAKEHTENFTRRDWEQLWDDFVREYDSMEFKDKHGEVYSHKTNFAGSIYSVWLHLESDSGIPHLHVDDEFDYRETANHKELTNYAVALFVGMMDVPTVPSGGDGGTSNDLPWGQKGDEDEMERARRCAHAAVRKLGKKPKLSIRR